MANTTWSTTDKTAGGTLSGGNLVFTGATNAAVRTIDRWGTGKYYFEYTITTLSNAIGIGVGNSSAALSTVYNTPTSACIVFSGTGGIWTNNVNTGSSLGVLAAGNVIGIAIDHAAKLIWFRVAAAGNWNGSGTANPATGAGGLSIVPVSPDGRLSPLYGLAAVNASSVVTANFGDSAFTGAVPSGYTSGFSTNVPALIAADTQVALEQWADGNPRGMLTQIALEEWAESLVPNGLMRVWDGTKWAYRPVKYWTGSAWVAKPVKFWNGSAWTLA